MLSGVLTLTSSVVVQQGPRLHHAPALQQRTPAPIAQVNSDSRATEEYFDYLLGRKKTQDSEDGPSIIVGSGRIGSMLLDFGSRRGFEDVIVGRGEPIPEIEGPVSSSSPWPAATARGSLSLSRFRTRN